MSARVTIRAAEVQTVQRNPEIKVDFTGGVGDSCLASQITWDNAATMAGLREMFKVQDHETVETITINERGIHATFGRKK